MERPPPVSASEPTSPAKHAEDILQTRAALTEVLIRSVTQPIADGTLANVRALVDEVSRAIQIGDAARFEAAVSAFRWQALALGSNEMALAWMRVGDDGLRALRAEWPRMSDPARRERETRRWMLALSSGDLDTALQAAMAHIEMDQQDFLAMSSDA